MEKKIVNNKGTTFFSLKTIFVNNLFLFQSNELCYFGQEYDCSLTIH